MILRSVVKRPLLILVSVGALAISICAHDIHRNPYTHPDSYHDSGINYGHPIPGHQDTEDDKFELRDDLAIQVRDGDERRMRALAHRYGLEYLNQVFDTPAVFHLRKQPTTSNRERRSNWERDKRKLIEKISKEPGVEWVDQQKAFTRQKRGLYGHIYNRNKISGNIYNSNEEAGNLYRSGKNIIDRSFKSKITSKHEIQADVFKSRRAIDRLMEKTQKRELIKTLEETPKVDSKTFYNYLNEDLDIDDVLSHHDGNIKIQPPHLTQNNDYQGNYDNAKIHSLPNSGDEMVNLPLSKNWGYGYQLPLIDNQRDEKSDSNKIPLPSVSNEGRVYDHRDIRFRKQMQQASGHKVEGYERSSSLSSENSEQFGKWIDQIVENSNISFNDPFYKEQWYLHNTGQLGRQGHDLNVTWAWLQGYTGLGVILSVLDDGLQTRNEEISSNYASSISYSLIHDGSPENDPSPRLDPSFTNSHGTYCAAIMAAVPNNSICGVGVAFNSKVGAVRLVDGRVTDIQEATALSRHIDKVDIFSASWGPTDDGTKVEGPGRLAKHAFVQGVTKGRGGKGVIYVWASGNGGMLGDNCNLDGYTSSIYTLSVSALTDVGDSTFYEEPCASTLAAVYVGGDHTLTEAKDHQKHNSKTMTVVVPELDGHCSQDFEGTSAAAPLMAGVVALVLEANKNLTWRDVQHLVVETSSPTQIALQEKGWNTNGDGKLFHLMQGFGAVNAGKMIEAALQWQNVQPQKIIIAPMFSGTMDFPPYTWMNITRTIDSSNVPPEDVTTKIEHVVANITLSHPMRQLLSIFIVSPSGTTSQVLTHRASDNSEIGFKLWGFMSVHFWGEDPQGIWKVAIKDASGKEGYLKHVQLIIYGT